MQMSREVLLSELRSCRAVLDAWIKEVEAPAVLAPDGSERPLYPDGVPAGTSVEDLEGVPVAQLRAELALVAGKLDVITGS